MSYPAFRARTRAAVTLSIVAVLAGHLTVVVLRGQGASALFTYSSTIGTVESGGIGTADFLYPVGLAVGPQDRIYVADTGNERIQVFNADGTFYAGFGTPGAVPLTAISQVWNEETEEFEDLEHEIPGGTPDGPFEFNYPSGLVVDQNGKILVVDSDNHRMLLFAPNPLDGTDFQHVASFGSYGNYDVLDPLNRDLGPAGTGNYIGPTPTLTGLNYPTRVAIRPGTRLNDLTDTEGRVALVDGSNHRVIVLDAMLNPLFAFGTYSGNGNLPGNMELPWGVGMDLTHIYVTDWANHRTETYTLTGQIRSGFGSTGSANNPGATERPFDVQPDGQGHLVVADRNRSRVLFLTPDSTTTQPLCSDAEATRCSVVATDGTKYEALVIGRFTATGQELGKFSHPQAVATDSKGRLLVLDTEGHRVAIFRVAQISIPSVSVSAGPVQCGQTVTLQVTVKNDGADPITVAPLVTANLAGTLTTPAAVLIAGNTDSTFTLPFVAQASGQLTFTVRARGNPAVGDPIFSSTVTTEPVTVKPTPGRQLDVSVSAPARVGLAAEFTVQLIVTNNGTVPLTAVQPFIELPADSVLSITSSPDPVAEPLAPGVDGAAGESRTYNFALTASATGTPTLTGRATANYEDLQLPGAIGVVGPLGTLPTASIIVDSDVEPPVTSIVSILPAALASGWYLGDANGDVTVTLSATDNTPQGILNIKHSVTGLVGFSGTTQGASSTFKITQDGGNQLTYFAEDLSNNPETPHTISIKIDSIPPKIQKAGVSPSANAAGWINQYPTVSFDASDDGSGVEFSTEPVKVLTDKAGIAVTGSARDFAGHSSTTDPVIVNVDTTAPTVVCAPTVAATGLDGWYKAGTATVTVRCDAIDQSAPNLLSGIAVVRAICPSTPLGNGIGTTTPALTGASPKFGPTSANATCVVSAEGIHAVYGEAVDVAGNLTTTQPISVKIDRTAPTVVCGTASGGEIWSPNHKMVLWNTSVLVTDAVSASAGFTLTAFSSTEAVNWTGDGNTNIDMTGWTIGTPDVSGYVRAERLGTGTGRNYRLLYEGMDGAGNVTACTNTLIGVPHDQDKK